MRARRLRPDDRELTYFHVISRCVGSKDDRLLGDVEKERFFYLVQEVSRLYTVEVLSLVVMSNHWHMVVAASPGLPSREEASRRFQAYYGDGRYEPSWDRDEVYLPWAARMRDVSCLVKDIQQRFTCWYNRTRPVRRRGTLWADRYRSVVLEGNTALWQCIKYVELNPVRAMLVDDPADYRSSSWGRCCQSGKHPFGQGLLVHLKRTFGERAREFTLEDVLTELRGEFARVIAFESGKDADTVHAETERARKGVPFSVMATRRVRYWSDGLVIGSKAFVREVTGSVFGEERVKKKQFGKAEDADLFAFRKLRVPG